MTVPPAPFPATADLFRALGGPKFGQILWADDSDEISVFVKGRVALASGIETLRLERKAQNVRVWIPGYFCNEALDVLRTRGVELRFYPVQEDLSPDWDSVQPNAPAPDTLHVFVLVHYFGFPNDAAAARTFCDVNQMTLIEDAAHMIRPLEGTGFAEMMLFAPWKMFAVPSGGVLWRQKGNLRAAFTGADFFSKQTFVWLAVRSIQNLCVRLRVSWHGLYRLQRRRPTHGPDRVSSGERCDSYAIRLLHLAWLGAEDVIRRRRENYQTLEELSKGIHGIGSLFDGLPETVCPYGLPLVVDAGSSRAVANLTKSGIPASQWPDLPPEVIADPVKHRIALEMFDRLLLLPVHQSLRTRDLTRIGAALRSTFSL